MKGLKLNANNLILIKPWQMLIKSLQDKSRPAIINYNVSIRLDTTYTQKSNYINSISVTTKSMLLE